MLFWEIADLRFKQNGEIQLVPGHLTINVDLQTHALMLDVFMNTNLICITMVF